MEADARVQLHRLQYSVRGPEWAFAVPQGDLDALVEVMSLCCGFWNGVNSLIVPVSKNGRVPRAIGHLVETRGSEQLFVHAAVPDGARDALMRDFPAVTRLWDEFDERERHPLTLWASRPRLAIPEPDFSGPRLARIKLATWGLVPDQDRRHWERTFDMKQVAFNGSHAKGLLDLQIEGRTPLLLTGRHISVFESSIGHERHVWLFGSVGFTELVNFWNCRSRMGSFSAGPRLVGAPSELLAEPDLLEPIMKWATTPSAMQVQPSILASIDPRDEAAARRAFEHLGFRPYEGRKLVYHLGRSTPDAEPTYQLAGPMLSGPMKPGVAGSTLITVTRPITSISLPVPPGFEATGGGKIRLQIHNLPLPLPANNRLAQAVFGVAAASFDGIVWAVDHTRDTWDFDVVLPEGWEALRLWAEGQGYEVALSQPGRYGQALLGRLEGLSQ